MISFTWRCWRARPEAEGSAAFSGARERRRRHTTTVGLVEGQCKFVVARRFKGNGMGWRAHDNRCVLRTRLALQPSRRLRDPGGLTVSTPIAAFGIATRRPAAVMHG